MEELAHLAQLRQPQHPQDLLCLHLLQKHDNEFCRKQEAGEGEGLGVCSHLSWITSDTMILAKYTVGQALDQWGVQSPGAAQYIPEPGCLEGDRPERSSHT